MGDRVGPGYERVTSLGTIRANRKANGRLWSVQEMLEEALEDYRSGKHKFPKGILLLLDDAGLEDGKPQFATNYYQAGMAFSQIIGLLAIMLHRFTSNLEAGK